MSWTFRVLFVAAMAVLLFSCAQLPRNPPELTWASQPIRWVKQQDWSSDINTPSIRLSVLTYNVAGLPWPVETGRRTALEHIAREIAELVQSGVGPDIVLIQEGFVAETSAIGTLTGYTEHAMGPGLKLAPALAVDQHAETETAFAAVNRRWWKGEGIGTWTGSGLHIFSAYPIVSVKRMSFGPVACAGYDCLANKGAVMVRVLLPGSPQPVDILTTHLNSTNAAGVSKPETDAAHKRQVQRLKHFLSHRPDPHVPFIMAGDFNTRGSQGRFIHLAKQFPDITFVKETCQEFGGPCHCAIDFTQNAPWLHSQDLQGFESGSRVAIQPIEARNVFNAAGGRPMLSDHIGYLVTYELRWGRPAGTKTASN